MAQCALPGSLTCSRDFPPPPTHRFAFFVTFLLVFRTQYALERYRGGASGMRTLKTQICNIVRRTAYFQGKQKAEKSIEIRRVCMAIFWLLVFRLKARPGCDGVQAMARQGILTQEELAGMEQLQVARPTLGHHSATTRLYATANVLPRPPRTRACQSEGEGRRGVERVLFMIARLSALARELPSSDAAAYVECALDCILRETMDANSIKTGRLPFPYLQMLKLFQIMFLYTLSFGFVGKVGL